MAAMEQVGLTKDSKTDSLCDIGSNSTEIALPTTPHKKSRSVWDTTLNSPTMFEKKSRPPWYPTLNSPRSSHKRSRPHSNSPLKPKFSSLQLQKSIFLDERKKTVGNLGPVSEKNKKCEQGPLISGNVVVPEASDGSRHKQIDTNTTATDSQEDLDSGYAEFNNSLDEKARLVNMSAKNVKSVIHHILKSEQVVSMLKDIIEPQQPSAQTGRSSTRTSSPVFGVMPTMTRAKVKEMLQKMPSPVKLTKEGPSILDLEFTEEDDDDEYHPEKDEESHDSDDDSILSSRVSELGSPYVPATPQTPTVVENIVLEDHASKAVKEMVVVDADGDHEVDLDRSMPLSVVVEPLETYDGQVDTIALRTRSKLPLTTTSLTDIESAFVAPDITRDMYDIPCEDADWLQFLSSLYKTADDTVTDDDADANDPEFNYIAEAEREQLDEEDFRFDKPTQITKKEMTALINELSDLFEDEVLPYQVMASASQKTTVKKTPDALNSTTDYTNSTMVSTGSAAEISFTGLRGFDTTRAEAAANVLHSDTDMGARPLASTSVVPGISNSAISQSQTSSSNFCSAFTKFKVPDVPVRPLAAVNSFHLDHSQLLQQHELRQSCSREYTYQNSELDADMIVTPDLKALIEDNLRKHIQLLLQSYLLCLNNRIERHISLEFKSLLEELYGLSTTLVSGADSILSVCNLEPAIRMVYDSSLVEGAEIRASIYTEPRCVLTPVQKLAICNSTAFVYPHFLPCLRKPKKSNRKYNTFTPHEDNLIALGLHNFQSCQNVSPVELIYELLIRGKSMEQIFYRIQYMSSGRVEDNPIKSVKKTGNLPSNFPEPVFDHFYPTAPKDQSSDQLPTWVTSMKQSFTQGITEPLNGIKFSQAKTSTRWNKPDNSRFILPNIGGLQPPSDTETSCIRQEYVNERHVAPLTASSAYHVQPQDYQVLTVPNPAASFISADIPQITGIFIQFDSSISRCFPPTVCNNTPANTFHKFMNQENTGKIRIRTKRKASLLKEKRLVKNRSDQFTRGITTSMSTASTQTEDVCSSSLSPDLLAKTMLSCGIEEPDSCSSVINTNQDVDILNVSQQEESSVSSRSVPENTSSPSNSYSVSEAAVVNSEVNKSVSPMENPVDSKSDNQSSNEVSSSCIPASSTVQTTSTRKTIRQIYQALANNSNKTEPAQHNNSKSSSDCNTTRMVSKLSVSNAASGCGVLQDLCKADRKLHIDPLQVEADSPGQDLVPMDSANSSENTETHFSPVDSVESSSCQNLELQQNKTPFIKDATKKTEVSPVTTPTKLRPLVAKALETSVSPPYVPLPKFSPGKKKLQSQIRQILPKSFLFGIKSSSPTKAAAQHLKRRAAYYCQNRSPVKILPKFAGTYPGSSSHKVSSSVVNKLFRPPSTISRRQKECKKRSNTSKGLEEAGQTSVMEVSKTEVDESELSQEEEDQCQLDDLMAACTTIGYDPNKGNTSCSDTDYKTKAQKKREMCLSMLEPDILDRDPRRDARDTAYAQHYFNHLKQVLSDDPGRFKKFLLLLHDMNKNHMNPIELYADLATLIPDHQALVEDFAGFLLSYQAVECNCFLPCQEYQQILTFLRRLEICCDSSTWMFQRTLKMMSKWVMLLNQDSNVDVAPLREKIGTLLRHVPSVMNDLLSYFFGTPLPDSHYEDYEEVDLKDDTFRAVDEFEEVTLPESWDSYNTKLCTCPCHQDEQDEKLRGRIKHCSSCSLKIFDGQPVLNTSRNVYRPITVLYPAEEKEKMMRAKKEAAQLALAKARAQKQQNKKKSKNVNHKHTNRRPLKIKNKLGRLKKSRLVESTINDKLFIKNLDVRESRVQLDGEKCNNQSNCEVGQDPIILNMQRVGVQAENCDDDRAVSAGVERNHSNRQTRSSESSCYPQENLLEDDADFRPVGVISMIVPEASFRPRSYDSNINSSNLSTSHVVSQMEITSPDNIPTFVPLQSPDSYSSGFSTEMCPTSCSSSLGMSGNQMNPVLLEGQKDQTEQASSYLSHHSCCSLHRSHTSESCITNSNKSSLSCPTNMETVSTPDQTLYSRRLSCSDHGTATLEHNSILTDVSAASKKLSTKYEVSDSPIAKPSNNNESYKESRTSTLSGFNNLETSQATVDSCQLETWSEEDDRTILNVITVDGDTKEALALLVNEIQDKTLDQIKNRAKLLMVMLDQMTDTESDSAVEEL